MPACTWPVLARVVEALPAALLDRAFDYPGKLGTEGRRKVAALVGALRHGDILSRYRDSVSLFDADDIADVSAAAELREQACRPVSNELPWLVRGSTLDSAYRDTVSRLAA